MNARRLGVAVAVATLAASGTYVFVYLYRWEWNRALMSGVIFLAAEIALIGGLLADRLRGVDRRLNALAREQEQRTLEHLRSSAPAPRTSFAWLSRPEEMNVFVPVIMGAGVLLSGVAWAVERLARVTARPVAERALAHRLGTLALPAHGFLDGGHDHLDLLRGPIGHPSP